MGTIAVPFNEEVAEVVAAFESLPQQCGKISIPISSSDSTKLLPSVIQAPSLKLKPLQDHLKYVFLGDDETLPVIVSSLHGTRGREACEGVAGIQNSHRVDLG
ncbi:hypothetical protein ACFX1R_039818 [Malus domestica]